MVGFDYHAVSTICSTQHSLPQETLSAAVTGTGAYGVAEQSWPRSDVDLEPTELNDASRLRSAHTDVELDTARHQCRKITGKNSLSLWGNSAVTYR